VATKISDALHPENITIFLDDEDAGAYVVAFSSDASKAGVALAPWVRNLVLTYDDELINRLRNSARSNLVDFDEGDQLSQGPGPDDYSSPCDPACQTLRAVRSSLLIPIASNGRLLGLVSLGRRLSDLPYSREGRSLLLIVANQIATFVANMKMISRMAEEQRIARELEMAAEVQRHLFPLDGLKDDVIEICGTCLPARGIGGDYYDYFDMDAFRTGIAIADVAGKGIAAALLMSTVQASLRSHLISGDSSLVDIVSSMNRLLRRSTSDGGYATFFFAEFDKATFGLTYVNAGHNPPMLVRRTHVWQGAVRDRREVPEMPGRLSDGAVQTLAGIHVSESEEPIVRLLTTGGPIIGTFLDEPYQQETIQLQRDDMLVVYTDGVTEALNPAGLEFGEERLRSIVVESLQLSASESARKIIGKVLEWQGQAAQHDDITLIVAKVK
jgi:sigma-B regulation protein RsbU (phosphoserine phosphatase)